MYADDDYGVSYPPTGELNQAGFAVIDEPISQDDLWVVISSFFAEKGLVQQQLSSFNEFIERTLNDVMEEHGNLTLDQIAQNSGATYDQSVSYSSPLMV
jgi:DNA-directed RNA polymerase II subunit RPB2